MESSAEARISLVSDIEVRNAVWVASAAQAATNWQAKRLDSRPDRLKKCCDAEDAHHSFEVVGENMKAHLSAHPLQSFGQEVGTSHPVFERSKRMSNGLSTNSYHRWIMMARYELSRKVDLSINANNVFVNKYATQKGDFDTGSYGAPRNALMTLNYKL